MPLALPILARGIQQEFLTPRAGDADDADVRYRFTQLVNPALFLKASGEVLFVALAGSLALTAIFNPKAFESNLLHDRLGYNNVCTGFDEFPANIFASPPISLAVYFAIRYRWLDQERAKMQRAANEITARQFKFDSCANSMYIASLCIFPLVLVVPPTTPATVWFHSACFLQLVIARYIVVLSNFMEAKTLDLRQKIFIVVYGVVSFVFPLLVIIDYATYDTKHGLDPASANHAGVDPAIPGSIAGTVDYCWFFCLGLSSLMMPDSPDIHTHWTLVPQPGKVQEKDVEMAVPPGRH